MPGVIDIKKVEKLEFLTDMVASVSCTKAIMLAESSSFPTFFMSIDSLQTTPGISQVDAVHFFSYLFYYSHHFVFPFIELKFIIMIALNKICR